MPNKQSGFGVAVVLVVFVVLGLVAAAGYFVLTNKKSNTANDSMVATQAMPPLIRGVYGQNVSAPYKYAEAPGLAEALGKIAENNPCQPTEGRFKQVVLGVTADKSQALIGNSCGSTGVLRTFIVKQDGAWKSIGIWKNDRTDFSSLTDTPSCDVVRRYDIQKSIAPVCYELKEGQSDLLAGDMANYSYVVR